MTSIIDFRRFSFNSVGKLVLNLHPRMTRQHLTCCHENSCSGVGELAFKRPAAEFTLSISTTPSQSALLVLLRSIRDVRNTFSMGH